MRGDPGDSAGARPGPPCARLRHRGWRRPREPDPGRAPLLRFFRAPCALTALTLRGPLARALHSRPQPPPDRRRRLSFRTPTPPPPRPAPPRACVWTPRKVTALCAACAQPPGPLSTVLSAPPLCCALLPTPGPAGRPALLSSRPAPHGLKPHALSTASGLLGVGGGRGADSPRGTALRQGARGAQREGGSCSVPAPAATPPRSFLPSPGTFPRFTPLEVPSSLPRDPYELHTSVGVFLCAEAKLAIFMRAVFPTALRGLRSRVQRQ